MPTIEQIFTEGRDAAEIIADLRAKSISVPSWYDLEKAYNPEKHPVITEPTYNDLMEGGKVDRVTRITYDLQRLAVKRMKELCFGIPVKRVYDTHDDEAQQRAADIIEEIFKRNRIDSVNLDRATKLFASCEVMTLWYGVQQKNNLYGVPSDIKVRCATYSPMDGDTLYPLFDERGDLIALSVEYTRMVKDRRVTYFDAYTADKHKKWCNDNGWTEIASEDISLGKIPAVYTYRPTPIWEDTSRLVYEMEWAMSRNGNYIRKNSRPMLAVYADEQIPVGQSPAQDEAFKDVAQFPIGSRVEYVTWAQSIESLKFHLSELRQQFFTQLQLPDWSYESMKSTPMSGESRKQLFIDAQLKVKDESARLLEMLDREVNVIKEFVAVIDPSLKNALEELSVTSEITPFTLTGKEDEVGLYSIATGGKAMMSQKTAIARLGFVKDADEELEQIANEAAQESMVGAIETAL